VVQSFQIYESENGSAHGIAMKPSKSKLANSFETENTDEMVNKILTEGKVITVKRTGESKGYIDSN
jgi:ribosome maturation protein Sdo1